VEIIPQVSSGTKTRQTVAKQAGFGNETTYRQAAKVVDRGTPELISDGLLHRFAQHVMPDIQVVVVFLDGLN
jgi:hypothetical protein